MKGTPKKRKLVLKLTTLFYRSSFLGIRVISPQKKLIGKIGKALELIRDTDAAMFRNVLRIKHILIFPGNDYYGVVFERHRTYVDQPKTVRESSLAYFASGIVHEAWHMNQYARGLTEYGAKAERGAYRVQRRFLQKTGTKSEVRWLDKQYTLQWWEPKRQSKKDGSGYDTDSVDKHRKEFMEFVRLYRCRKLKIKDIDSP